MRKLLSRGDLLPQHMNIFVLNGEERYQYRGKKLLTVAMDVIASHLLCKYESLSGAEGLILISKGRDGTSWFQNQSRASNEDARRLFGDGIVEFPSRQIIAAEEIRVYNPRRRENARLPLAVISQYHRGAPMLIALECSPEEAVGLIHELTMAHLISDSGFVRLTTVLNEFSLAKTPKKSPL